LLAYEKRGERRGKGVGQRNEKYGREVACLGLGHARRMEERKQRREAETASRVVD
jgi:hypothetical protein